MKKFFSFVLMLAATLSLNATQYCQEELTNDDKSIKLSCELYGTENYQVTIESESEISGLGGSFVTLSDGNHDLRDFLSISDDKHTATISFSSTSAPYFYTPLYVMMPGEVSFGWPNDIEWGLCGSAADKSSPDLSLNATEKTLDAGTAETFQIIAERKGDGAITFESSNAGIASVDETGLVTAVGRGTATITVRVAETENYQPASKKLAVTVTGPLNWDAIEWLAGSNEKYKVVTEPVISDQFGGKHIEEENLWIGFPSAVWGDNSGIEHSAVGAGVSFPLSQFPNEFNEFNFICDGVTYLITLYYKDGVKATAIDVIKEGTRARKVIENGNIVIIRDGVKFNVLGTKL